GRDRRLPAAVRQRGRGGARSREHRLFRRPPAPRRHRASPPGLLVRGQHRRRGSDAGIPRGGAAAVGSGRRRTPRCWGGTPAFSLSRQQRGQCQISAGGRLARAAPPRHRAGAHARWTAPAPAEPPLDDVPTSSAFAFGLLDPRSDHALARIAPFWQDIWMSSQLQWWLQAGQYTYTPDRRPLLGPTEIPGLAVNTGYSGHGIMGSIGGSRRAVDAISGRLKPGENPFRPDRPMQARAFDVL